MPLEQGRNPFPFCGIKRAEFGRKARDDGEFNAIVSEAQRDGREQYLWEPWASPMCYIQFSFF